MKQELKDVAFLINTYNRPDSLRALINSIKAIDNRLPIYVIDDGSDESNNRYKFDPYVKYKRQKHKGKHLYWQTCNDLFDIARDTYYKWFFMLGDDMTIKETFIDDCLDKWHEIKDHSLIALNLYVDRIGKDGKPVPCWTCFDSIDKGHSWQTQWVDMIMMFDKRLLKEIGRIPEIKRNWEKYPQMGSGVGSYISRVTHLKGYHLYMVKESLVTMQDSHRNSVMNPPSPNK